MKDSQDHLVHQDPQDQGSVQLFITENRIELQAHLNTAIYKVWWFLNRVPVARWEEKDPWGQTVRLWVNPIYSGYWIATLPKHNFFYIPYTFIICSTLLYELHDDNNF